MPHVNSTAMHRVEYENGFMSIWFTGSHNPYTFCRVPLSIYSGLMASSSKGGYYNTHIRDRYQC